MTLLYSPWQRGRFSPLKHRVLDLFTDSQVISVGVCVFGGFFFFPFPHPVPDSSSEMKSLEIEIHLFCEPGC